MRLLGRFVRLVLAGAIYALVLWYGIETAEELDTPPVVTGIVIALVALGIAGSIYRILIDVAKEAIGGTMVLAAFLNERLVEPQRRRLMERGRALGRAEGRAEGLAEGREEVIAQARARLLEEGIDPDLIFPSPEENDDSERC